MVKRRIRGQKDKLISKCHTQLSKLWEQKIRDPQNKRDNTEDKRHELNNLDVSFWMLAEAVRSPEQQDYETRQLREEAAYRLSKLTVQQMEVIKLKFFSGKSYAKIAIMMGINKRRVQTIARKAMIAMRKK